MPPAETYPQEMRRIEWREAFGLTDVDMFGVLTQAGRFVVNPREPTGEGVMQTSLSGNRARAGIAPRR